jgi:hypothetical protein
MASKDKLDDIPKEAASKSQSELNTENQTGDELPPYDPVKPPPRYSNPLSKPSGWRESIPANAESQSHAESCGMPASVVQGVLAPPQSRQSNQKTTRYDETVQFPQQRHSSSKWNVQGVPLGSFGNPFRRSSRKG